MKVIREQRGRVTRAGKTTTFNAVLAAESGTCSRCLQPIEVGERVGREAGNTWSHRDCIRLRVAMPRSRRGQVSDGWGSACRCCDEVIVQGDAWMRVEGGAMHASCKSAPSFDIVGVRV